MIYKEALRGRPRPVIPNKSWLAINTVSPVRTSSASSSYRPLWPRRTSCASSSRRSWHPLQPLNALRALRASWASFSRCTCRASRACSTRRSCATFISLYALWASRSC